jgi:hypothetical protein
VFAITRTKIFPDSSRSFDWSGYTILPWMVRPFSTPTQRLTLVRTLESLCKFANRTTATSVRDFSNKIATTAASGEHQGTFAQQDNALYEARFYGLFSPPAYVTLVPFSSRVLSL